MPRTSSFVFYVLIFTILGNFVWADCETYRNLEGCAWVDGACTETPLGERCWPHGLWGEGEQAGSTTWYTKLEVVARAPVQAKLSRVLKGVGKTSRLFGTSDNCGSGQIRTQADQSGLAWRRRLAAVWPLPRPSPARGIGGRRSAIPRTRTHRFDGQRGDRIPYT